MICRDLNSDQGRLLTLAGLLAAAALLICYFPNLLLAASAAVGALLILAFLARPRTVILFFLLIRSSLDVTRDYFSVYLSDSVQITGAITLSVVLILSGLIYLLAHRRSFLRPPLAWVFLLFLALAIIHFLIVEALVLSLMEFSRFFSAFLVYLLVWDLCRDERDLKTFIKVILLSSLLPIGTGLYQGILNRGEYITGFMRAYGTFSHPEPYAFYLILILALAVNLFFHHRETGLRGALFGLILATLGCVLFSFTRTAWFGALLVIFFVACFRQKKLIWVFFALLFVFSLLSPLRARFYDLSTSFNSLVYRLSIWRGGVEQLPSVPVLGWGLGSFAHMDVLGELAHNDYLRLIFELGLLGLLIYLVLAGGIIIILARALGSGLTGYAFPVAVAALSVAVFFLIGSTINNLVFRTVLQWYFWALMAISLKAAGWQQDR